MGPSNRGRRRAPPRQIETCEPRVFLSAQPLADLALAPPSYEVLESFGSATVQLIEAHNLTGLSDARASYGFSGEGQTVVVIDSGIAYDHVALGGGFGAGYQVVGGWDFTEENDADPYDDGPWGSHGTHVAGIVASQDQIYPGVAPDVDLVALRVFNDSGEGYFDWIEDALTWVHDNRDALENPITTVNLSIGSSWNSDSIPSWAMLEDAFAQLEADGIFISVAAGNDFTSYNSTGLTYPAASSFVVPVASVDDDGSLSYFSQRNDRVIAAPGRNVISTLPDYVGNLNGRNDDFGSYSGTSMAAPYVAGASVLLREALGLVGTSNVTQDIIYDWMWDTADLVFDATTGQNYHRLNVARALDAIMPGDDFGSTPDAAHALGTVVDATSFTGLIGRLDDRDYFSFTAAVTGTLTVHSETSFALAADWDSTAAAIADGATLTLDVVAGESYVIGLGTTEGLGYYDVSLQLEPGQIDLGTITSNRIDGISLGSGLATYTLTASRDGLLTVEALFSHTEGGLGLELFDMAGNRIASSMTVAAGERIDVAAAVGQSFVVQLTGTNSQVDLRLTNLVHAEGPVVYAYGTDADDSFSFVAGTMHELVINGVSYQFNAGSTTEVEFFRGAGDDRISLNTSALVNGLKMVRIDSPTSVRLVEALPGDANLDGTVDQADYVQWAQGFGVDNPDYRLGDFNQDGVVNSADYTIWANNFGATRTGAESIAEDLLTEAASDVSVDLAAVFRQETIVAGQRSTVADRLKTAETDVASPHLREGIAAANRENGSVSLTAQSLSVFLQFAHPTDGHTTTPLGTAASDVIRSGGADFSVAQIVQPEATLSAWITSLDTEALPPPAQRTVDRVDVVHATESEPWCEGELDLDSLRGDEETALAEIWWSWRTSQTLHDDAAEAIFAGPEDQI